MITALYRMRPAQSNAPARGKGLTRGQGDGYDVGVPESGTDMHRKQQGGARCS